MRVLMRRLVPGSVPLSPSSFDELLAACRRTSNLKRAWRVFRVMTQQYGMAPSQSSYQCLTELVAVNFSANTHGREQLWHVNLCRRLVEGLSFCYLEEMCFDGLLYTGTVLAYAGDPPLWVYVDMANTLVLLNGYRGYREMVCMPFLHALAVKYMYSVLYSSTCQLLKLVNATEVNLRLQVM